VDLTDNNNNVPLKAVSDDGNDDDAHDHNDTADQDGKNDDVNYDHVDDDARIIPKKNDHDNDNDADFGTTGTVADTPYGATCADVDDGPSLSVEPSSYLCLEPVPPITTSSLLPPFLSMELPNYLFIDNAIC